MNRTISRQVSPNRWIACLALCFTFASSAKALEVYATSSPTYNVGVLDTNNPLVMNENSTAVVYLWLSYTPSEQSTINTATGLFSGGFALPFVNPSVANITVATNIQEAVSDGGVDWTLFTPNLSPPRAIFNQFLLANVVLPANALLVGKATISSFGLQDTTEVTMAAATGGSWQYGPSGGRTTFTPNYNPFNVTVVPEPSTYALATIGVMVLGYAGRRKRISRMPLRTEPSL